MKDLPEEIELNLDPLVLSPRKNVVRTFYKEMWDKQNVALIPEIFHEDFTFRGSLGPVLKGHAEFEQYVLWLTTTLDEYTSDILEMIEEGDCVSGKLRFHGIHADRFFGHEPSRSHIWWYGAPIFRFEGNKVKDLWVLGDIYGLVNRLNANESAIEFSATPDACPQRGTGGINVESRGP